LSDIPVKIISDYVMMFEKNGILNHLFKYELEGVSLNKRTVDELRNNFKDDSYLFRSIFNKIEKWLLYKKIEIKLDGLNVDLEFCYHFLETVKLLETESFYEDYKERIDQIIEKIESTQEKKNELSNIDAKTNDSISDEKNQKNDDMIPDEDRY
jgi:hypothetical protein